MKKTLLIVAVAGLAMVACKKDRVCSCKYYETTNGANAYSSDYSVTYNDVSRKTAFNACVHSKQTVTTGTVVVETDINCELK